MVRPAGILVGYGGYAKVPQRGDPLLENGVHGGVALGIDAANLPGAVVHVEIRGDEFLPWFEFQRSCCFAHKFWNLSLVRRGGQRRAAEMLVGVTLAPKQPLFLPGPERNANRSPWLNLQRGQNA